MDVAAALRDHGHDAVLQRPGTSPIDVAVRVFIRGFTSQELAQGQPQGVSVAIISNDEIAATSWPGPPRKGDRLISKGRTRMVDTVETRLDGDRVVRHDMRLSS